MNSSPKPLLCEIIIGTRIGRLLEYLNNGKSHIGVFFFFLDWDISN